MDEAPPVPAAGVRGSVTLHDVAREAGVSIATASRALNGSARNVRTENASRVRAAAAKLNYRPHPSAQAVARGSTPTVALVVGDVADPYFSAIAAGVTQAAEAAGLVVTMAVAGRSPQRELELVRTLRGQRPRVIVVAGTRVDNVGGAGSAGGAGGAGGADSAGGTDTRGALAGELEEYQAAGGRVVMVSQRDLPFDTVTIDNTGGAHRLALALAGAGYRRFAIFRAPDSVRTSRDRVAGFTAGLHASGLTVDDRFVFETEFTRGGGYDAARKLAERGAGEVEVVFAVNDVMAIGAMTAFRDAGLVPGEDIAVAGFDDIDSAIDVTPALTSVAVPLREAGRAAMRLALGGGPGLDTVQIPTGVVLRESTPIRR
ncbi:LacI family DNA-binding transcriptional regulator [Nonomuraea sp. NPDC049714]|uniref:LacI family DNA-binding transcriptional regulator n=1 Tax=Nonomuraea sp. NPDC049714 TaxID=3364357 RepID=UPI0037877042